MAGLCMKLRFGTIEQVLQTGFTPRFELILPCPLRTPSRDFDYTITDDSTGFASSALETQISRTLRRSRPAINTCASNVVLRRAYHTPSFFAA
jgi:hypothetical protein